MAIVVTTTVCLLLVLCVYSFPNLWRVQETWKFLLRGRQIMLENARKSPEKPYSLPIPGNRLHVLSSRKHWNELNNAPTNRLSPNAASREMFQPKYTFGFDWGAPREHVSIATVRSIKNMTQLLPLFQTKFVGILDQEFQKAFVNSPSKDGWTQVSIWTTIQRAVTRINSLLLLGEDIANDDEFITRSLTFVKQTTLILEAVRIFPSFLAPLVTKLIKGRGADRQFFSKTLRGLIAEREEYKRSTPEASRENPGTFLEGVVEYCHDDRSTQQNLDSITSTWVISTLAIPVVACQLLQDVYLQIEHFSTLREEIESVPLREPARPYDISQSMEKLPLLDAFTMESWRTKCFQSNTVHRVAMKDFEFSDGYIIPAGEAVEFHQHSLMTNESLYPDHKKFDPSRFLNKNKSPVDTGIDWPFWGAPRYICPGRWLVVNVEKLLAVYVMQNYEAKLESSEGLNFEWRDGLVVNPKSILLMKPRSKS
ncbi:cytochrome P450 [Massariosphaeria phaeospora]|uniref:Cytochrome P450 n=1 Tax=Massariosphaeria phaeospora TaxID=100035 RepID=A0A7C8IFZ9_9PLEO|nr:cytochrome P450 [Massariosphaeria phaeospora]